MTRRLADFADEFAERAEDADDAEQRDAYAVLAAVARGERPAADVARRVLDRARAEK